MITNQQIERAFAEADMRLNNQINRAQLEFYKPEIIMNMKLMEKVMKKTLIRQTNNPLEVYHGNG